MKHLRLVFAALAITLAITGCSAAQVQTWLHDHGTEVSADQAQSLATALVGSPHHMDPLLVCIRTHESGGRYTLVNHPYSGAYEFLSPTWRSMSHSAGLDNSYSRAADAPPALQDEVAWWGLHHNPSAWTTYRHCV